MKKGISILFLFVLMISMVSAGQVSITISPNNPSIPTLNHGKFTSLSFVVSNSNDVCSLQCKWILLKESKDEIAHGEAAVSAKISFSIPLTLTAPTKEVANQDSGHIEYTLTVECAESNTYFCKSIPDTEVVHMVLNYDLTSQEKEAKNYVNGSLSDTLSVLKESEASIYNINSKISSLPKNVLIEDIKTKLSTSNSNFLKYKGNYDSVNALYKKLLYIEAKSILPPTLFSSVRDLREEVNRIKREVDDRVKLHNEVANRINSLKESAAKLKAKSSLTKGDVNSLISKSDSITSDFEKGSFESYIAMQKRIDSATLEIAEADKRFDQVIKGLINQGNQLIVLESSKVLGYNGSPIRGDGIESINTLCSNFALLKSSFEKSNEANNIEYIKKVSNVEESSKEISKANENVKEIISLRNKLDEMINIEGVRDENPQKCEEELSKISRLSVSDVSKLGSESYISCVNLTKTLSDIRDSRKSSFTFKFMRFFRKIFSKDSFKLTELKEFEYQKIPEKPRSLGFSNESLSFNSAYCNLDLNIKTSKIDIVNDVKGEVLKKSDVAGTIEHEKQCCSFDICGKCCEGNECRKDSNSYPVIFIHGHSFFGTSSPEYSLDAFNKIQYSLFENKYRIGGVFLPTDRKENMIEGEWGKVKIPITVKATYYYDVYNSEGKLTNAPSKQESISEYAKRLGNIVELIKYRTGREKVIIIAHSMGGLVVREYIKNGGESSVYKLIMIGTPNHGVNGSIAENCDKIFINRGAKLECAEMTAGSDFLKKLNEGDETFGSVKYYTIRGEGCLMIIQKAISIGDTSKTADGDGVVPSSSVKLDGATNIVINGKCESPIDTGFHSNLLDPDKYPQTLEYINKFLKE